MDTPTDLFEKLTEPETYAASTTSSRTRLLCSAIKKQRRGLSLEPLRKTPKKLTESPVEKRINKDLHNRYSKQLEDLVSKYSVKQLLLLKKMSKKQGIELASAFISLMKPYDNELFHTQTNSDPIFLWEGFELYLNQPGHVVQTLRKLPNLIKKTEMTVREIKGVKSHLENCRNKYPDKSLLLRIIEISVVFIDALEEGEFCFDIVAPRSPSRKRANSEKLLLNKSGFVTPLRMKENTPETPVNLSKTSLLKKFFWKEGKQYSELNSFDPSESFLNRETPYYRGFLTEYSPNLPKKVDINEEIRKASEQASIEKQKLIKLINSFNH